jgi:hypothetical protein
VSLPALQPLQPHVLFGHVPDDLTPLLTAGLDELGHDEREALIADLTRAQAALRASCTRAAFASGRAVYLCPPTADELLHYTAHRIRINEKETEL